MVQNIDGSELYILSRLTIFKNIITFRDFIKIYLFEVKIFEMYSFKSKEYLFYRIGLR